MWLRLDRGYQLIVVTIIQLSYHIFCCFIIFWCWKLQNAVTFTRILKSTPPPAVPVLSVLPQSSDSIKPFALISPASGRCGSPAILHPFHFKLQFFWQLCLKVFKWAHLPPQFFSPCIFLSFLLCMWALNILPQQNTMCMFVCVKQGWPVDS